MARIIGKNAWISFGGTVISTDYRTFSQDGSADTVDLTAGADAHKTFAVGAADDTVSIEVLIDGTAAWVACLPATEGTLIVAPEGSTSGKPKTTAVATVSKRSRKLAYNDVYSMAVDWVMATAPTDGTI